MHNPRLGPGVRKAPSGGKQTPGRLELVMPPIQIRAIRTVYSPIPQSGNATKIKTARAGLTSRISASIIPVELARKVSKMAAVERFWIPALTFCVVTGIAMLCASEEVTLVISKQYYAVGETVYFTVTNGLADSIAFIYDPIYEVRDSTGTEIFPVTHGEWLVYFEPGHSETLFWRQQYPNGSQVPEGMYYITAKWVVDMGPPDLQGILADTLWITQMSAVEPAIGLSWGRIKVLFR